jgi:ubiquitin-like modifier-activating enzyme ATG7
MCTRRFGFPALKPPAPFTQLAVQPLAEALPAPGLARQICAAADAWRSSSSASSSSRASSSASPPPFCLMQLDTGSSAVVATAGLSAWAQLTAAAAAAGGAGARDVVLAMFDACHLPLTPGWPLRNALLLAAVRWRVRALRVVCVRDSAAGRAAPERCFVVEVRRRGVLWHECGCCAGEGWVCCVSLLPPHDNVC